MSQCNYPGLGKAGFKARWAGALSNPTQWKMSMLIAGGLDQMAFKGPFQPKYSMIPTCALWESWQVLASGSASTSTLLPHLQYHSILSTASFGLRPPRPLLRGATKPGSTTTSGIPRFLMTPAEHFRDALEVSDLNFQVFLPVFCKCELPGLPALYPVLSLS